MDESANPLRAQSPSVVDNRWILGLLIVLVVAVVASLFIIDLGS